MNKNKYTHTQEGEKNSGSFKRKMLDSSKNREDPNKTRNESSKKKITVTTEIQRIVKKLLWTTIRQQAEQCGWNGQIPKKIQSPKTESVRTRKPE